MLQLYMYIICVSFIYVCLYSTDLFQEIREGDLGIVISAHFSGKAERNGLFPCRQHCRILQPSGSEYLN